MVVKNHIKAKSRQDVVRDGLEKFTSKVYEDVETSAFSTASDFLVYLT